MLAVIVIALVVLSYQLLTQQGRLLLRIEALERRPGATEAASHAHTGPPPGLPVGSPFSAFVLKDTAGDLVSLDSLRGSRALIVHWSPQCGYCDLIASELAALTEQLNAHHVQPLLVSYDDAPTNREMAERHGLRAPIVLLDGQRLDAFDQMGTPVAYLLDQDGRVARPLAVGADDVLALAREAAGPARKRLPGERPLSESLLLRDGLKPGTPAPRFSLPDLTGRTVSLDDYRGRRVLLVFSDPQCGPCDQLAPHLVRLEREHRANNLAVVMVSRGDREENRRKARANGMAFPVVVQDQWKLSKEYGIFATPVAFLIGADGTIERPVAKGVDEILGLAQQVEEPAKEWAHGHVV